MKRLIHLICIAGFILSSCATTKNITYFQDIQSDTLFTSPAGEPLKLRPDDKLSIVVNSRDNQLMNLFNLPYTPKRLGETAGISNVAQGISLYTIDKQGFIDFPTLGKIKAAGLSREQLCEKIKGEIESRNLAKDAVVVVEYTNLYVSVMGEVAKPGHYPIDRDEFTILHALSAAGDLTIYGLRDKVKLIRHNGSKKESYTVNLCNTGELLNSPAYYIQQGDVIYVEPNDMRRRQSTVNGNNVLSTSFWISIASLAATISLYFVGRR